MGAINLKMETGEGLGLLGARAKDEDVEYYAPENVDDAESPDEDWDAEERRSKMARSILDGPDADTSFAISVQQLSNFAASIGTELKRVENEKNSIILP